jgi:competence protein ComEC
MERVGPALGLPHAERASGVAPIAWLVRQLEAEQERWFLWLPVMFGGGIALYFLLPVEPWTVAAMLPVVAALAVHLTVARGAIATLMTGALLATALGIAAAKLRTEAVRAPALARQVGPVDVYGFVELVEPRASKGQRLTVRVTALRSMSRTSGLPACACAP